MLGAIAGDVIGSVFEKNPVKTKDFILFTDKSCFTDDTVLSVAVAEVLLEKKSYRHVYREFFRRYPHQGYGIGFIKWVNSNPDQPDYSHGNGSAMRVSPVGWAFNTLSEVLVEARKSAIVTHNYIDGIRGAQTVAAAVFLARTGYSKTEIKRYIQDTFFYDLDRNLDDIRREYSFDNSCRGSVPESIIAFLESADFEDAIRNAVSLGGDSDTMACISGAIAEAYYKAINKEIIDSTLGRLPAFLEEIAGKFIKKYCQY